ncbi:MAG: methionine adenosyltransferase [Candidatus Electryonea clarkiae]|nr:methionine adenosyltransferase [Candidatus Electryonea clarkiae]MDP8286901.1 methionine adenosyltransferase [Candidatus Electryonea clarkiae]
MADFLFSSESVTEGHPDKIADQISDAVLDAIMAEDPFGRVACESFVTTGMALVGGEISTTTYVDIPILVRQVIREIGYINSDMGFDANTCSVLTTIDQQASDIAMGVDKAGAGDQGIMFGYACKDTEDLMPMPIQLSHKLTRRLSVMRKDGTLPWLRPDGKSQVSVKYEDDKPVNVTTVVVSTQHSPDIKQQDIRDAIIENVINPVIPSDLLGKDLKIHINPTGRFVQGGPHADAGLTGRKIIVDTYGGFAPHGGGCFSGKDPTKVDRSASYMARYAAKNVVAAGLAERCTIQLAYAIGVAEPVSFLVRTENTGKVEDSRIEELLLEKLNFTPSGIIEQLDLRKPIYRQTAAYGHFGRSEDGFTWERTDELAPLLKKDA